MLVLFFIFPLKLSSWNLVFYYITIGLQNPKCFWIPWGTILHFHPSPQSIPLMIYSAIYCFLSFQMPLLSFLKVWLAGLIYSLFHCVKLSLVCFICFSVMSWRCFPLNSLASHIVVLLINSKVFFFSTQEIFSYINNQHAYNPPQPQISASCLVTSCSSWKTQLKYYLLYLASKIVVIFSYLHGIYSLLITFIINLWSFFTFKFYLYKYKSSLKKINHHSKIYPSYILIDAVFYRVSPIHRN